MSREQKDQLSAHTFTARNSIAQHGTRTDLTARENRAGRRIVNVVAALGVLVALALVGLVIALALFA